MDNEITKKAEEVGWDCGNFSRKIKKKRPSLTAEEIIEYKKEQKEYFKNCKVGSLDKNGYKIKKIFSRSDDIVIYEIEASIVSESLRFMVYPCEPHDPNGFEENFSSLKVPINEVKSSLYKARRDNAMKHRIASVVAMGIYGEIDEAEKYLDKIKREIDREYEQNFKNKLLFLFTSLSVCIFLIALSTLQYLEKMGGVYGSGSLIYPLVYAATFGSMGGFLSISIKLKRIDLESGIPWYMFVVYGVERSIISIFAAIILFILIKSNIFLGFVIDGEQDTFAFMLFSVVAGFSEKLIPDLLGKLEKNIDDKENS